MINYLVRIRRSKKEKRSGLWRSREPAAKILAPLHKRKAGNLAVTHIKTLPVRPKR
jgi:hypothetical protein